MSASLEPTAIYEPGTCLAPGYVVIGHLRRGSLLDVYDCWSVQRRSRCVAKIVRPDRAGEHSAQRRLLREGLLLRRLAHPHLVRVYEVTREPVPMIILETLTGATLGHLLNQTPRGLGPADVAVLGIQLCSAVQYLHGTGVLHLDLKPSNIVVDGGQVKVIDLDIARPPGRGRGEGTRQYMAPEQVRRGYLGPATDVWGIGMVLFEASTGRLPFEVGSASAYPQVDQTAAPVRRYRRRAPSELCRTIENALQCDPAGRPSVDEIAQSLSGLVMSAPRWIDR